MTRTIVKHSYISRFNDGHEKACAHLRYLEQRPGRDVSNRSYFSKNNDNVSRKEITIVLGEQGKTAVVMHKLILSPGVQGADLKAYTRNLMDSISSHKGQDLNWYGIGHRNTDHDHVHVVVMPKDQDGRLVRFYKEDYKQMRYRGDRFLWQNKLIERKRINRDRYSRQFLMILKTRIQERGRRKRLTDIRETSKKPPNIKMPKGKFLYDISTGSSFRNWVGLALKTHRNEGRISRAINEAVRARHFGGLLDKSIRKHHGKM